MIKTVTVTYNLDGDETDSIAWDALRGALAACGFVFKDYFPDTTCMKKEDVGDTAAALEKAGDKFLDAVVAVQKDGIAIGLDKVLLTRSNYMRYMDKGCQWQSAVL